MHDRGKVPPPYLGVIVLGGERSSTPETVVI
jgi:hypothetical protein